MTRRDQNITAACLLISVAAFVTLALSASAWDGAGDPPLLVPISLGLFVVSWIATAVFLAKAKGYNPALGLLGLLWLIGIVILVLLPDRTERS